MCFHGVVAREVRSHSHTKTSLRQYLRNLSQVIISSVPLIVLGFARLIATWGVHYQEHVTEYGTHWNFFFTLAVVKVSVVPLELFFQQYPHFNFSVVHCCSNKVSV